MKTAQQAAANWQASAGRAGADWQAGVEGFTGDWAGATTRQKTAWIQGLADAQARGSWENGINRVGTAGWKSRTVAKAANYTTGFAAGAQRQAAAAAKIQAALANIVPSLPARGTFEQNKVRATTLMDNLHALRGQLGA